MTICVVTIITSDGVFNTASYYIIDMLPLQQSRETKNDRRLHDNYPHTHTSMTKSSKFCFFRKSTSYNYSCLMLIVAKIRISTPPNFDVLTILFPPKINWSLMPIDGPC